MKMTLEKFTPQIDITKTNDLSWHALRTDEVLKQLDTLADQGLSDEEAQRRLQTYGPNQLAEKPPTSFLQMLWDQFNNFVVMLLIVASVISAFLGDYVEAAAILAIVVLNATLGVVQERRAEQALAALKKLAAPEAHVIRDGYAQDGPLAAGGARRRGLAGSRQFHPGRCAPARSNQFARGGGGADRRVGAGAERCLLSAWRRISRWATAKTPPLWARWSITGAARELWSARACTPRSA